MCASMHVIYLARSASGKSASLHDMVLAEKAVFFLYDMVLARKAARFA